MIQSELIWTNIQQVRQWLLPNHISYNLVYLSRFSQRLHTDMHPKKWASSLWRQKFSVSTLIKLFVYIGTQISPLIYTCNTSYKKLKLCNKEKKTKHFTCQFRKSIIFIKINSILTVDAHKHQQTVKARIIASESWYLKKQE